MLLALMLKRWAILSCAYRDSLFLILVNSLEGGVDRQHNRARFCGILDHPFK